jgi:hypothetical protein
MDKAQMKKYVFLIVLMGIAIALPLIMVKTTYLVAPLIIIGVAAIFLFGMTFWHYHFGVFLLFIYGSIIFYIDRLLMVAIPYGIAFDFIIVLIFLALLINLKGSGSFQWKTKEPITIIQFIFYAYFILQIANPNAVSISAWLASARFLTIFLLFYILLHFFKNKERIRQFNTMWITVAMIVAAYGIFQEYFGLRDFEWRWVRAVPNRYDLLFVWGNMRKFSILSDPSAYGLFLAFCGTSVLMLALGPVSALKRMSYIGMTLFMFFAMSFAGTRTAYAMIVVAVVLFILLNLRNPKILGASLFVIMIFTILMVGPFYSGPINRMRSTLNFSEDASMGVRDHKRIRLQAYVKTHPIGGGINTAGNSGLRYSRGHPLAGPYDPDSGYLRTALEMGWIGVFMVICLNASIVISGIYNYFNLHDPELRAYNLAFMIPFLGLSVAYYTQDALFQKPVNILVIATYALMIKVKDIDADMQNELPT